MALTTARISSSRWRPPGLGGGIKSLIRSHSVSVRSVGYCLAVIPPVYRTGATYGRLFKQPLRGTAPWAQPTADFTPLPREGSAALCQYLDYDVSIYRHQGQNVPGVRPGDDKVNTPRATSEAAAW